MAGNGSADILLLDEPTASLDRRNALRCMGRAADLTARLGLATLVVTHDMALAAEFGTRLLVLRDGRITHDVSGVAKDSLDATDVFALCGFDKTADART